MLDKENVVKEFLSFVSQFSESDMRVRYKKGHTFRVAENCRFIAEGIGLNLDNIDLAWLCGMLHDIGRFKQVEERETFRDSKDFTHAEYGCKILFEEGLISRFCDEKDWYDILYKAIYNHSFLALPEGLTRREELFCNIVRDADKIDIIRGALFYDFKMFHEYTEEEIHKANTMEKMMTWYGIMKDTLLDDSVSKLAELLLNGTVMGIIEGNKILNHKKMDKKVKSICEEYLHLQDKYYEKLKRYL